MNIYKLYPVLILALLSFDVFASTTYQGLVTGRVDEIDGNEYGFFESSESFGDELFVGLSQKKGQKLYWSKQGGVVEASADNKYLVSISIAKASEETFDAVIKLFITSPESKSNLTTSISTNEIGTYQVNGDLNAKNEYQFIDDGKHSFYLKIEIDRVFSIEEKRGRLLTKHSESQ